MRLRLLIVILLAAAGLSAIGAAILYCCALHAQHEAAAFLSALSEAQVGVTSRDEFMKSTARFKELESQSTGSDCRGGKCLTGPSLGFENSTFGRFHLLPPTGVAVGVYFDSQDIYQGSSVILVRYEVAYVHMEEESEATAKAANAVPHWSSEEKLHLHLDPAHRHDLTRLRVSCFTSWFGCDTARELVSGGIEP
jgi:hypothetical protein